MRRRPLLGSALGASLRKVPPSGLEAMSASILTQRFRGKMRGPQRDALLQLFDTTALEAGDARPNIQGMNAAFLASLRRPRRGSTIVLIVALSVASFPRISAADTK
jgi:hypothetical protein